MQSAPFFHFVWSHLVFLAISRAPFMFIRFSSTSKIWSHSSIQPSTRPGEKITLAGQVHLGGAMPQTGPASLLAVQLEWLGNAFPATCATNRTARGSPPCFPPKALSRSLEWGGWLPHCPFFRAARSRQLVLYVGFWLFLVEPIFFGFGRNLFWVFEIPRHFHLLAHKTGATSGPRPL